MLSKSLHCMGGTPKEGGLVMLVTVSYLDPTTVALCLMQHGHDPYVVGESMATKMAIKQGMIHV